MDYMRLSVIAIVLGALAMPVLAQDDGWVEADSSAEKSATYNGSTDSEFEHDEEYASAYARYKAEATTKAEINRQRNEGFSKTIMLGVRAQAGANTFFGDNSSGWGMGFNAGGGLMLKMNFLLKNLSLVPELTFNYRHYAYEKDMDAYTNEASIDIFMFEIPIIFRYTFEDYNIFVGAGVNMGLKLKGSSEFETSGGKNNNTISTSAMEVGGVFDIGYMLTRWVHIDLRVVQCFTSLLNKTLVAEESFFDSSLRTFYTTVGVSFLF